MKIYQSRNLYTSRFDVEKASNLWRPLRRVSSRFLLTAALKLGLLGKVSYPLSVTLAWNFDSSAHPSPKYDAGAATDSDFLQSLTEIARTCVRHKIKIFYTRLFGVFFTHSTITKSGWSQQCIAHGLVNLNKRGCDFLLWTCIWIGFIS